METKVCTGCGEKKPLDQFYNHSNTKDRLTSKCKICVREEVKIRRGKNPDYDKQYREQNREEIRSRHKKWVLENPEKFSAAKSSYRKRNREKILAYNRLYYTANKDECNEASRMWRVENPEAKRAHYHKRRARLKGALGHCTDEDIRGIYVKQRMRCPYCKTSIRDGYHIDHIVPLARGGTNWPDNIQLTCASCNMKKHASDPIEFANRMGMLV